MGMGGYCPNPMSKALKGSGGVHAKVKIGKTEGGTARRQYKIKKASRKRR